MCMGGGGGGIVSDNSAVQAQQQEEAANARKREEERQARVTEGVGKVRSAFDRYDSSYFDKMRGAFVGANQDQLVRQQNKEGEQALYGMARAGLINSSAGNQQRAELAEGYARQNNALTQGAEDFVRGQKDQLYGAQQTLEAQVRSSGDAEGSANAATAQAGNIARTPTPVQGSWLAPALTSAIGAYGQFNQGSNSGYYDALGARLFPNGGGRSSAAVRQ